MNHTGRMLAGAIAMLAMTGISLAAPAKAPPELPPQAKVGGVQLQADPVRTETLLAFERPTGQIFVLERYDPKTGTLIDRVVEPLKSPTELVAARDFTRRINGRLFRSYGLDVCPVKKVFFFGELRDCTDALKEGIRMLDPRASVILCRALNNKTEPLVSECFRLGREKPDVASSLDDGIVLDGFADLVKDGTGVLRPDLVKTQFYSVQQETGMHGLNRGKRK